MWSNDQHGFEIQLGKVVARKTSMIENSFQ